MGGSSSSLVRRCSAAGAIPPVPPTTSPSVCFLDYDSRMDEWMDDGWMNIHLSSIMDINGLNTNMTFLNRMIMLASSTQILIVDGLGNLCLVSARTGPR